MELSSTTFADGDWIPRRCALFQPDAEAHAVPAGNLSPALQWSGLPDGARSLVLLCLDPDAPTSAEDVNQEGREVPADLPRAGFVHWLACGLAAEAGQLAEGAASPGFLAGGKAMPPGPDGWVQGANDYRNWFSGVEGMDGPWCGYDGPGPPWNDARVHRYRFHLWALDVELSLQPGFRHSDLVNACEGHVLEEAVLEGRYTQNPRHLPEDGLPA